jgi:hypothetical protein
MSQIDTDPQINQGNFFLICIFFIAMIVAITTILFGILYDNAVILLNGYSVFGVFGILSLLIYSFNISRAESSPSLLPSNKFISQLKRLNPISTVLICALPLVVMIIHLLNSVRLKVKYNEKDNDELYWSNVTVFFLILVIIFGGLTLLNNYSDNDDITNITMSMGNVGLVVLSGICMFIINKMNVYTKFYSTSG